MQLAGAYWTHVGSVCRLDALQDWMRGTRGDGSSADEKELPIRQWTDARLLPGRLTVDSLHEAGVARRSRLGQPSDIAPIAVFLTSDEASWLTGEIISASGGLR